MRENLEMTQLGESQSTFVSDRSTGLLSKSLEKALQLDLFSLASSGKSNQGSNLFLHHAVPPKPSKTLGAEVLQP